MNIKGSLVADKLAVDFLKCSSRSSGFRVPLSPGDVNTVLGSLESQLAREILQYGVWEWVAPNLCMLPSPWVSFSGVLRLGEWNEEELIFCCASGTILAVGVDKSAPLLFARSYTEMWAILFIYEKFIEEAVGVVGDSYARNKFEPEAIDQLAMSIGELLDEKVEMANSFWHRQIEWHYSRDEVMWF